MSERFQLLLTVEPHLNLDCLHFFSASIKNSFFSLYVEIVQPPSLPNDRRRVCDKLDGTQVERQNILYRVFQFFIFRALEESWSFFSLKLSESKKGCSIIVGKLNFKYFHQHFYIKLYIQTCSNST